MAAPKKRELFAPERALAFSDGVFAVAITLLVIDLRLPPVSDAALLDALLAMRPKLVIFAFTFVIVGMGWLAHHRKFSYIHRVDGSLLWLNLAYLLMLCLVPFATSVLSEHGNGLAFILYALVMMLLLSLSAVLSAYSLREPYLAGPGPGTAVRQDLILSPLLTAVIFLVSAAIAFGGREEIASWMLLLIAPVSIFFGSRVRRSV